MRSTFFTKAECILNHANHFCGSLFMKELFLLTLWLFLSSKSHGLTCYGGAYFLKLHSLPYDM